MGSGTGSAPPEPDRSATPALPPGGGRLFSCRGHVPVPDGPEHDHGRFHGWSRDWVRGRVRARADPGQARASAGPAPASAGRSAQQARQQLRRPLLVQRMVPAAALG